MLSDSLDFRASRRLDGLRSLKVRKIANFAREILRGPATKTVKCNEEHGIEPASIIKSVDSDLVKMSNLDYMDIPMPGQRAKLGLDEIFV